MTEKRRIGIFAGTFDPVHTGHITFALQALDKAHLDEVMFLPERRPRRKSPEHYGHRVAMLRQALRPHEQFGLLELVEAQFSVRRSLPHLRTVFGDAQLVLLVGSDVLPHIPSWPLADRLLQQSELVVAVRAGESPEGMELLVETWPQRPQKLTVFESYAPVVSSQVVRGALRQRQQIAGVLSSVLRYSRQNWLYVSFNK